MILQDKVAVVYGAGGAIGGAVARAFADEGATVYVTGRRAEPVEALANEIVASGGSAEAAVVDALDEQAVGRHLETVIGRSGRVDISFNAVGIPDREILGVPLAEIDAGQLVRPITEYATSYFVTARQAARRMTPAKSGVIMTLSALPGRTGTRLNGGYGAAMAAKEQLTRDLSLELAPHGIRVVGLLPHGIPETATMRELYEAKVASDLSWEQFSGYIASMSHTGRVMRLDEVANMAAFLASDRASGMTGTTVNLTMGGLYD